MRTFHCALLGGAIGLLATLGGAYVAGFVWERGSNALGLYMAACMFTFLGAGMGSTFGYAR